MSIVKMTRYVDVAQKKSPRGRKKTVDTRGQACRNPDSDYREITDPAVHALVGYRHHGFRDQIEDFYCQACHHKFSARRHTALYHLKTSLPESPKSYMPFLKAWALRPPLASSNYLKPLFEFGSTAPAGTHSVYTID